MAVTARNERDLREACVQEALSIIESEGVEALSLREVARRLKVSHQAPYKHFANRDHILAEIVRRAFDAFAQHLNAQAPSDDVENDMLRMGEAYLVYARSHPLQYRLMFGTPLPDTSAHPDMMASARHAFDVLRNCVLRLAAQRGAPASDAELDAVFLWCGLHGLASILETSAISTLTLPQDVISSLPQAVLSRLGIVINAHYPSRES
jgi:AcrR family transcriptional regulator